MLPFDDLKYYLRLYLLLNAIGKRRLLGLLRFLLLFFEYGNVIFDKGNHSLGIFRGLVT